MAAVLGMEVTLLISLYVVLIQVLRECQPSYAVEDDMLMDGSMGTWALMKSEDCALAVSTAALYDYCMSAGLICFDDDLRFLYDDSRWIEFFRMDKATIADMCYELRVHIEK
jgi:hypothetical protein